MEQNSELPIMFKKSSKTPGRKPFSKSEIQPCSFTIDRAGKGVQSEEPLMKCKREQGEKVLEARSQVKDSRFSCMRRPCCFGKLLDNGSKSPDRISFSGYPDLQIVGQARTFPDLERKSRERSKSDFGCPKLGFDLDKTLIEKDKSEFRLIKTGSDFHKVPLEKSPNLRHTKVGTGLNLISSHYERQTSDTFIRKVSAKSSVKTVTKNDISFGVKKSQKSQVVQNGKDYHKSPVNPLGGLSLNLSKPSEGLKGGQINPVFDQITPTKKGSRKKLVSPLYSPIGSSCDASPESSNCSEAGDISSPDFNKCNSTGQLKESVKKGLEELESGLSLPFSSFPTLPTVQITEDSDVETVSSEISVPIDDQPRSHPCSPRRIRRQSILTMGFQYLIVANPPERAKDDSSVVSKNGQLSRTGSLTVLRRSTTAGASRKPSVSSPTSSVVSADSDSYASVNLGTDKLPPIDTPEASHFCSIRLRHLLRRLDKEEISKEDLVKNLEYAASVLETVYIDETRHSQNASNVDSAYAEANSDSSPLQSTENSPSRRCSSSHGRERKRPYVQKRRLCDEEDELSEVEPDAVPSEVRDWLALTFTRSMSNIKRRGEEKPRFRSVAHAIRAGIMVDRIYRRMSSSVGLHVPPNVLLSLKNLDEWTFNVFSVAEAGDGHAIKFVGYELLQKYDLITKFKINTTTLDGFLMHLEQGYGKYGNPYHNLLHGADVAQTVHCVLMQSKLGQWLTDLEVFATIIAALIHDFEHTGTTNNFHIMTGSELALLYNDKAVLENHHISSCFKLFKEDDYNILSNLSREEYREFRALVIDMVLATDMSYHFQQIKNMKNLLSMPENIDKSKALSLVVHCADISHPAKDLSLHINWTERLLEEFFRQGDREQAQGLPFSPLCDRKNTLVAESQIGFIEFIVDPSFNVMGDMLGKIMAPLHQQQSPRKKDSSISEEVFDTPETLGSTTSSIGSRPTTPRSPGSPGSRHALKRPWNDHLITNKQYWKERAAKDAAERALQHSEQLASAAEQSDSGVESPNPAKDDCSKTKDGDDSEKDRNENAKTLEGESEVNNSEAKDSSNATQTAINPVDIRPLVKGISRQTSTTGLFDKVLYSSPGVSRQTSTTSLLDRIKSKPTSCTRTSSTQSTEGDEGYFSQATRNSTLTDSATKEDLDNVFEPTLTAPFGNLRRLSEVDVASSCSGTLSRGNSSDGDRGDNNSKHQETDV